MRLRSFALCLAAFCVFCFLAEAAAYGAPPALGKVTIIPPAASTTRVSTPSAPEGYQLTPEQRAKAIAYSRDMDAAYFASVALSALIYLVFWRLGFGVRLRALARRLSSRLIVQCAIVVPLVLAVASLLVFPLDLWAGFLVQHRFGLSVEPFPAWLSDWTKSLLIDIVASALIAWIFYTIVRRSPRRWWFNFWLATIPLALFVAFIEPWAVEPLFYKFQPLASKHPALVTKIEALLNHADLQVSPRRILEMNASAKTNSLDAYVSGFGPSKRLVIWDTSIRSFSTNELLLVVGHEVGHYVLHHVLKELVWIELVTLAYFFVGFKTLRFVISRWGARRGVESENDVASFPLLMLALTLLAFFSDPAVNAISRHYEHQADQFALEVNYGVVPDPNQALAHAFQILGARDLSDPNPNALTVFWLYSHPPIADRIRFAEAYKPWASGRAMKLLRRARE